MSTTQTTVTVKGHPLTVTLTTTDQPDTYEVAVEEQVR